MKGIKLAMPWREVARCGMSWRVVAWSGAVWRGVARRAARFVSWVRSDSVAAGLAAGLQVSHLPPASHVPTFLTPNIVSEVGLSSPIYNRAARIGAAQTQPDFKARPGPAPTR